MPFTRDFFIRQFAPIPQPSSAPVLFPTYVDIARQQFFTNSTATQAVTLTGSIPAGNTAVMLFGGVSAQLTGLLDRSGNYWTVDKMATDGFTYASIGHAYITYPLVSGSVISGLVSGAFGSKMFMVANLANCVSGGNPVAMTGRAVFARTVSEPSGVLSPSVCIGMTITDQVSGTYTGSNWTLLSEPTGLGIGTRTIFPFYLQTGVSGIQNPGGAYTGGSVGQVNDWVGFI